MLVDADGVVSAAYGRRITDTTVRALALLRVESVALSTAEALDPVLSPEMLGRWT